VKRCILLDIHVHRNILTLHVLKNVKSPNNTSNWQMGFNSAFKGLKVKRNQKLVQSGQRAETIEEKCNRNKV
jgi:hypothetical protein